MAATEILLGVFFLLVGSGLTIAMGEVRAQREFLFARLCFIAAGIDATFCFWEWLGSRVPDATLRGAWTCLFGTFVLILGQHVFAWVRTRETRAIPKLSPADFPMPQMPPNKRRAQVPTDALIVQFGSNFSWATRMPHRIVQIMGEDILVIDRAKKALIVKTLKIFDEHRTCIVKIEDNVIWVSPSIPSKPRPNRHTLIVNDFRDREVLNLQFLNPRVLSLTCVMRHPDTEKVLNVTQAVMDISGIQFSGGIFGESNLDIDVH